MTDDPWPVSASERAVATVMQAEAAATLAVPVNASQAMFGLNQSIVSSSARGPALGPALDPALGPALGPAEVPMRNGPGQL